MECAFPGLLHHFTHAGQRGLALIQLVKVPQQRMGGLIEPADEVQLAEVRPEPEPADHDHPSTENEEGVLGKCKEHGRGGTHEAVVCLEPHFLVSKTGGYSSQVIQ